MHRILTIAMVIIALGCQPLKPTSHRYFNCKPSSDFDPSGDKQGLIYQILKKALIEDKDLPEFKFILDKTQIYIVKETPEDFFKYTEEGIEIINEPLTASDIPFSIGDINFCLKSKTELGEIAKHTEDFIYIALGSFRSDGKIGRIGISTNWQAPPESGHVHLTGGGYVAEYVKEAEQWKFSSILQSWER